MLLTLRNTSTYTYDNPGSQAITSQKFQLPIWNKPTKQTNKHLTPYRITLLSAIRTQASY